MTPIDGIQSNQLLVEKERIELNANATPAYLPNQDETFSVEPQSSGIQSDFSKTSRRAILLLRNRNILDLNFIPNIGDSSSSEIIPLKGDVPAPPPDPSSGSVGSSSGTSSGEDVEDKALDAAEDLLKEANELADELKEGDWVRTDSKTGYEYIDPKFYEEYQKLLSLFNVLQLLGMIIDAIQGIKKAILSMFAANPEEGGKSEGSASETLAVARESGMLTGQGQLLEMSEEVMTHNQSLLEQRLNDARKRAGAEWYDYLSEAVTSGGSDAVSRHEDARYAEYAYKEIKKYENFMKDVQSKYERVLGESGLFNDGLTEIGDIFESLTWNNLTVDIDGGKVDIDRNKLMASQLRLSGIENYRRLYFMLQRAKQEIKDLVFEGMTGRRISSNAKRAMEGVLESLEKFESMVFSALTYQLQTSIAAQNTRVDAYNQKELAEGLYYSSVSLGSLPLIGGLTKNISDWAALEYWNATTDDATNPTQLDMNQVYRILSDLYGTSVEQVRNDMNSSREYIQKLKELEEREWGLVGALGGGVVYTADDGYKGIHEARVNALREDLLRIQNTERMIFMLVEALCRMKKITLRLTTGLGDIEIGGDAEATLKAGLGNRRLAFDLKFAGIKNKVEAHNKELKQKKQLEKARSVAAGSFVGMGVAVVLMAAGVVASPFTGGTSLVGAIAFVAAMGQLGAALSQIIFNLINPVDDRIHDQTEFYLDRAQDAIEEKYNKQIDLLDQDSHVDAEDSSDPLSAGNQWVKNTELFMNVRNKLTQIYIYEKLLLMYTKALQDIKSLATANFTGVYAGEDFKAAHGSSSDRFEQRLKAYELKESMVEDIISRRNLAVSQETEMNWAFLNAAISVVQVVTYGLLSNATAEGAKEAAQTWKWVNFGTDLGAAAVQITKSILDANSGYGELDEYQNIRKMIDAMVENSFDNQASRTLRDSLAGVNEGEMLDSIGRGKVSANTSKYYEGMRSIQHMYNRVILMLRVVEGIARIRARITGAPTTTGASEAFEAEKANHLKQLDLLNQRVQTYAERTNAIADAWRQLTISVVMVAVKVLMKAAEEKGLISKLKSKINEKLGTEGKGIQITKDAGLARQIKGVVTGNEKGYWDQSIGASDLVNLVVDLTISPQTIRIITQRLYDRSKEGDQKSAEVKKATYALSDSRIDQMDDQAYNNQLELAELGTRAAELGIDRETEQEFRSFLMAEIDSSIDSIMDDSWQISATLLKAASENPEEFAAVPGKMLAEFSKKLDLENVKWSDQQKVKEAVENMQKVIQESEDKEQAAVIVAAAFAADQIARDQSLQKNIVANLTNMVFNKPDGNSSRDVALNAYALGILGKLSKLKGKTAPAISEKQVGQIIDKIWQKVAADEFTEDFALKICEIIERDRERGAAVGIGRFAAKILPSKAPNITSSPSAAGQVSSPKAEKPLETEDPIYRILGRIKGMEWTVQRQRAARKEIDVSRHFNELKKEVSQLIQLDAEIVGIDLQNDPEGSQKLQACLKRINECPIEEMADLLQEFSKIPGFDKLLTPSLRKSFKESFEILESIVRELKAQKIAQGIEKAAENGKAVEVARRLDSLNSKPALREKIKNKLIKERGINVDALGDFNEPEPSSFVAALAQEGQNKSEVNPGYKEVLAGIIEDNSKTGYSV